MVLTVPGARGHRQELFTGVGTLCFCILARHESNLARIERTSFGQAWEGGPQGLSPWATFGKGCGGQSGHNWLPGLNRSGHTDEPSRGARDHPHRRRRGNSAVTRAAARSWALTVHSTWSGHRCRSHCFGWRDLQRSDPQACPRGWTPRRQAPEGCWALRAQGAVPKARKWKLRKESPNPAGPQAHQLT